MGTYLNQRTRDLIKKIVNDDDFIILEDGRVFKRVGMPDKKGVARISLQIGPGHEYYNRHVSCNVKDLVWSKFNGEIPAKRRVVNIDGDMRNNAIDNLALITEGTMYRRRSWKALTVQDLLDIQKRYNGENAMQLAVEYNVAAAEIPRIAKTKLED